MKTIAITTSAAALLLGSTALAGPVEDVVAQLTGAGYTGIEIEVEGNVTEVEARLNGMEREIKINTATGEILSDKTEVDDDNDDNDDNDDYDDDDQDDDDDDNDN